MATMKAMYVPWRLALGEGERILDDLHKWTKIDTIMLLDLYTGGASPEKGRTVYSGSQVAISPDTRFRVPVRTMTKKSFSEARAFMRSARSRGFKVASLVAPLFICGGKQSMACVDSSGRRIRVRERSIFYGCPNNPEVIEYGQDFLRGLVESWPELDFISLDHIEYPINLFVSYPSADLRDLFVCFCGSCKRRAKEDGFDMEAARKDVASVVSALTTRRGPSTGDPVDPADILSFMVDHPHLTSWLRFRMESMTHYTESIVDSFRADVQSRGSGQKMGFYFQLPSISNLVGTDHAGLRRLFDYAIVKFPDYLPGSILPIMADQIAEKTGAQDSATLLSAMRRLLDIGPGPKSYHFLGDMKDVILYSNATDPSVVDRQMARLSRFPKAGLMPHVWEHNGDVESLRQRMESLKKYRMKGYTVWAFEDGLTSENIRAASGVI